MIMIMVVDGWTAKEEEIEESVRNLKRVELSWAGCALKLSPQIAICTQHRIQMRVQIPAKAQSKYMKTQRPRTSLYFSRLDPRFPTKSWKIPDKEEFQKLEKKVLWSTLRSTTKLFNCSVDMFDQDIFECILTTLPIDQRSA